MKKKLVILFGGPSCEHQVSVVSAQSLLPAVDQTQYDLALVGITQAGDWRYCEGDEISQCLEGKVVSEAAGHSVMLNVREPGHWVCLDQPELKFDPVDVLFSVLHGQYGEDGVLQGIMEASQVPYVGCGVLASAAAMDKAIAKAVLKNAGIEVAKGSTLLKADYIKSPESAINALVAEHPFPLFIKPANMGSSVGISKVENNDALIGGLQHAFTFDHRVLVEQAVQDSHEVECAVLGNENPEASCVGEIIPAAEFYDYQAKYNNAASKVVIPALLEADVSAKVQQQAIKAFKALDCKGLARVDFFVSKKAPHDIIINEVNTLPGFTPISMYPQLWKQSGLSYQELVNQLIELAFEEHRRKRGLVTHVELAPSTH